jgi:uncharacterized membrane protein YjgN (DUF898 family)
MLLPEQQEFFRFFGLTPPPGMSAEGAQRFIDAYLKDPGRQKLWRQRPSAPAAATPAEVRPPPPPAPRAPPPAAARPPLAAAPGHRPVTVHTGAHMARRFEFTGSGGEYFGIWIVNLLLTILTLGIYSAWAKVRRLQYFYRHTELAGAGFDYHGSPLAILKGRLIALGLFLLYNISFQFSMLLGLVTLLVLAAALPWLLRSSFRFRLRNSSYRGLRFRFGDGVPGAYVTFLLWPLITLFTFYLATPWFHRQLKAYQHGNSFFGKTGFAFGASAWQFYREYLLIGLLLSAVLLVPSLMLAGPSADLLRAVLEGGAGTPADPQAFAGLFAMLLIATVGGLLLVMPMFQARMQNLVWNHTTLGEHRFESQASTWPLFAIQFTNAVLIIVTFGFFTPWARVRVARYRIQALSLIVAGSLDTFIADQEPEPGAAGEETADLLDFDIAL